MPDYAEFTPGSSRLPEELVERARAFRDSGRPPPPARAAATVALLRDGPVGVEAFLLRRAAAMAFAAGMHVFPGGSVDPRDADADLAWTGPSAAEWGARFGCDTATAQALVCAAVRETFEESGVLLAGDPSTGDVVADTSGPTWESDRLALLETSMSLAHLVAGRGLALHADLLRAWAHWITPEFESRRFDTRFFVAAVPPGQRPRDVGGEADRVDWVAASEAVRGYEAGEMEMLPPTVATLREMATYPSVADVLDAAAARPISPILPKAVWSGEELALVLPGEAGYDA